MELQVLSASLQQELIQHYQEIKSQKLSALVSAEQVANWTFALPEIYLDLSKNYLNSQTIIFWQKWWQEINLKQKIQNLHDGEIVNISENRPALHHLLRQNPPSEEIFASHKKMQEIEKLWKNQGVTDIVHIGIGGSELGMKLICEALQSRANRKQKIHFLTSPDPEHWQEIAQNIAVENVAIILGSKSLRTEESIIAYQYLLQIWGEKLPKQRKVIITAAEKNAQELDASAFVIPMWDWVGGRFSLSSALALPLVLQNQWQDYQELLNGMASADAHFFNVDLQNNLPVLLATLDVAYNHYFAYHSRAIITYSHALRSFPTYLQQLSMESLGKNCRENGDDLPHRSGLIIWGGAGTNSQHSFFQLLHQGSALLPLDMITLRDFSHLKNSNQTAQLCLHANYLAQMNTLMCGREALNPYQKTEGNRPSTAIILSQLNPHNLGFLLALYEHKTSVEALLYGINAYDQWGVEYGKIISQKMKNDLQSKQISDDFDYSTQKLIQHLKQVN